MKKFFQKNKTAIGVFALALGILAYKKGWLQALLSKVGVTLPF